MAQKPVAVSGIHLIKLGEHVIVNVEIDGQWFEVIREHESGSFSHIVEPDGVRAAKERGRGGTNKGVPQPPMTVSMTARRARLTRVTRQDLQ